MGDRAASMPSISSYAAAERILETHKSIRGRPDCIPLGRGYYRKFNYMSIHRCFASDGIACRLYRTDCVTFYPDGEIGIEPFSSKTTNDFVNTILRDHNIVADFNKEVYSLFWLRGWNDLTGQSEWRGYDIGRDFRFKPDPEHPRCHIAVSGYGHNAFEYERTIRSETRKALAKTKFHDFNLWVTAARGLGGTFIEAATFRRYGFGVRDDTRKPMEKGKILDCLAQGVEGWLEIIKYRGMGCAREVRRAIYELADERCFWTESFDYLSGTGHPYQIYQQYRSKQ